MLLNGAECEYILLTCGPVPMLAMKDRQKKLQRHLSLLTKCIECESMVCLGVTTMSTYILLRRPCDVTLLHDIIALLCDDIITWSREFSCHWVVILLAGWMLVFSLHEAYNAFALIK